MVCLHAIWLPTDGQGELLHTILEPYMILMPTACAPVVRHTYLPLPQIVEEVYGKPLARNFSFYVGMRAAGGVIAPL
jgi:hypothetical protein